MGGRGRREDHCTECGLTVWDWHRVAEERRVLEEMGALVDQVDFTEVGEASSTCTLCNGTRVVRWGQPDRLGGKEGPCLCTPEGQKYFERNKWWRL